MIDQKAGVDKAPAFLLYDLMSDFETNTITKERVKRPEMYTVVFLNDDYTPMAFVVHVLKEVFNLSHDEAVAVMLKVHHDGKANVGCYTYDVASTKATMVIDMARKQEYPLHLTVEKV